jgi:hypothetical protein
VRNPIACRIGRQPGRYAVINNDLASGARSGVKGRPTFFISAVVTRLTAWQETLLATSSVAPLKVSRRATRRLQVSRLTA